jgi:predicted nucleotidyltransferase component of viral defense system
MIPQRNLSLLSNRLAREGGRRIPEVVLERDYCLAWFLVGLSRTPLHNFLVFKGGTALKRCYFGGYRFFRNEPRDLYDLWYLTSRSLIDLAALRPEIISKLEFRGRKFSNIGEEFSKKEQRYRKLWDIRLASQMAELPHFDEVFRGVRCSMRAAQFTI